MADTTSTVTNTQDENNIITTTQLTTADPINIPEEINTNTTTTTTNNNNSNNNNNNNELDDFELIDKPLSSSESDNNNDNNNNNNNNNSNNNNNNNTDGSESGDSLVHILAPEATGTEENLLTGDPIYSDKTDDVTNIDSIATSTDSYQNVFEIGDDYFMQHGENNFNMQDNSSNLTADKEEITEIIIGTEVPAVYTENTSNLNETVHESSNNIQIIPESKDNSDIPLVSELNTKDLIEVTSSNNNNADSNTLDRVEQSHTNTETQDTYDDHTSGTVEILEPEILEQFPVSSVEAEPPLNIPDETHDSQLNLDIPIIDTDQLTHDKTETIDPNMVKNTPENITEFNTNAFQQNQPITPDIATINNDDIHEAETPYQFEPVQKIVEHFDNDSDSDPDLLATNNIPPDEIFDEVTPPLPPRESNPQFSNPLEKEFWTTEDSEDTEKCYINWKKLYTRLNNKSNAVYPNMEAALDPKNRPFNRWRDILANDNTRIVLDHPQTNYINANLITLPEVQRKYIMTQGPLDCTIEHFWCMIWQQRCPGIIMLNKFREKGRVKCANYYPDDVGEQIQFGCYTIDCVQTRDCRTYVYRRFVIHNTQQNESRRIVHFQYFLWPDMGVPDTPHDFLEFLLEVRSKGVLDLVGDNGPAVVHCSAGVGRSGTFILVDSCIRRLELDGHPNNIYVQNSLMQMRDQRFGCIQAPEQLRFSYIAIIVACYNIMSGKSIVEPLPNEGFPQETHSDSEGDMPIEDTNQPEPPQRTTSLFVSSGDDISMNSSDIQPMDIDPPSVHVEYNDVIDTTTDELRHRNVAPQVDAPFLTPIETTNEPHFATYDLTSRQYINKFVIFGVSITSFSILVALYYILF